MQGGRIPRPADCAGTKVMSKKKSPLPRYLATTGLLWLMWVVLTASFAVQELAVGLLVAALAALFTWRSPRFGGSVLMMPKRFLYAMLYIPYLVKEIAKANVDVARRVLGKKLLIKPGIVKVRTRLKSPLGRLILANSITLTPGTLSVDMRDEDFFIHWINVESDDIQQASRKIVAGFEKYLEVIFG